MRSRWLKGLSLGGWVNLREGYKEEWSALNSIYQSQVCDCVSLACSLRKLKQLIEGKEYDEFHLFCQLQEYRLETWVLLQIYCLEPWINHWTWKCSFPPNTIIFLIWKKKINKKTFLFNQRINPPLQFLSPGKFFYQWVNNWRREKENQILNQNFSLSSV